MELAPIELRMQRTPLPEVTELEVDSGWQQWDLAVRLQDVAATQTNGRLRLNHLV